MSPSTQAHMAIEAGCQWIDVDPTDFDQSVLTEIIETCKSAGIILVYRHHDNLLDEHRVHGVLLSPTDIDPVSLRESLGGHPIIGIIHSGSFNAVAARRADADYLMLEDFPASTTLSTIRQTREMLDQANLQLPIVISGIIAPNDIESIIKAGASGINIDYRSLKGPDYQTSLASFVTICNSLKTA